MKKPLSEEALIEIVGREQVGMRRMRAGPVLLLVVCAVVAYQNMARADDLSPAIFRGETGARMDRWDFANPDTEANEENWAPEESDSEPPGNMIQPETTASTFWERGFGGRVGVWRIDSVDAAQLEFTIPNVQDRLRPKSVIVQVTWFRTGDDGPVVGVIDGDTGDDFEVLVDFPPETTELDGGWRHTRLHYWSERCPSFESVLIRPPENGLAYIDQVVIDARCIPPAGGEEGEEDGDSPEDEYGFLFPFGAGVVVGILVAWILFTLGRRMLGTR